MSAFTSWLASPPPDAAIEIAPEGVVVAAVGSRGREAVVQAYAVEPLPAEAQRHGEVAVGRPVGLAAWALPARVAAEDHVIADLEPADALAQRLNHPRTFVTEHDRVR